MSCAATIARHAAHRARERRRLHPGKRHLAGQSGLGGKLGYSPRELDVANARPIDMLYELRAELMRPRRPDGDQRLRRAARGRLQSGER